MLKMRCPKGVRVFKIQVKAQGELEEVEELFCLSRREILGAFLWENPTSLRLWYIKGTKKYNLGKDSLLSLMQHDPTDLELICLQKNLRFRNSILGFSREIHS